MLYLFSSGTLEVGGVEVPVPFFLIRHPEGDIVVDGGNPLAVAVDARAHWGALADQFRVTEEQHCVAQLRELGIPPESVSHLVQSHLYIDHTGGLGHFPDATVIVQAQELDAARAADPPRAQGYVREDFDQAGLDWRPVEGELDLFGDGTIRLLSTPGHSAGHISLLLQLDETGPSCSPRTPRTIALNGMDSSDPARSTHAMMPRARWNVFGNSRMRPTRWSCSDTIRTTGRGSGMRRTTTRETAQGVDARAALVGPALPPRPV
jgi:N-acyl homoserine lactone hydrolase